MRHTFSRRDLLKLTGLASIAGSVPYSMSAAGQVDAAGASHVSNAWDELAGLVSLSDFEASAHGHMEHMAWEYINSGAADEITLRWNREAFEKIKLNPRVLQDIGKIDTRTRLLGQELAFPILLAPTALHRLAHPDGELATARGAGNAGATMMLSTMSSTAVEQVTAAATQPVWFQLYIQRDRGFTRDLVQRAEAAHCRALCVTVDTPVEGARNRQARAQFHLPPGIGLPNLRGVIDPVQKGPLTENDVFTALLPSGLTWKDIEWVQSFAKVPVLLKGILNADDAVIATKSGVAGILVSNHGARNLDTVPATIEALPRITDKVGGQIIILMDGGVRRGTDVLKALALGANAVLIGRPYVYGLAVGGAQGVTQVVNILRRELEMAMALTGRPTIASIDRTVLWS